MITISHNDIAILLSNWLTVPTIALSVYVVMLWYRPAVKVIKSIKPFSVEAWFIIGVLFGFLGSVMDNSFWLIAWTGAFLTPEINETFFNLGPYFNIIFRQLFGIFAAYCHIRSAFEYAVCCDSTSKINKLHNFFGFWLVIGFLYCLLMIGFK